MSVEPLTARGTSICRGCGAPDPVSVLDLGEQPLSNDMGSAADERLPVFPLHLRVCPVCALGQVGEFVLPERIFGNDYPYLSSTTDSWLEHAAAYAATMTRDLGLTEASLVLEVASNDGYLLSAFQRHGVRVVGVEPAGNVAQLARDAGVPTVSEFFGEDLARALVSEHGLPRLLVANNVMAHVPDLDDFVAGLSACCGPDTVVTIENPSLLNLLLENQFDTIYHEHFSYLSAHSVARSVARHGLELVRVEQLPTHGGSNRYWLRREGVAEVDPSVGEVLADEEARGLLDPEVWHRFREHSMGAIDGLRSWLDARRAAGCRVAAFGAAAKGNTLLNAAHAGPDDLSYAVDTSIAKQGRYLPGSRVPVLAPDDLAAGEPHDVLILPWNIAPELASLVKQRVPEAAVWVAVPEMTRLG